MDGRTEWTDKRLDDAMKPLWGVPLAVRELQVETKNLREALEVNSEMQKERNRIMIGFLVTLVIGLIASVVTLVVAL